MLDNNTNCDEQSLLVRNFPSTFTENEISEFLQMFDAQNIEVMLSCRAAYAKFTNSQHARDVIAVIHQVSIDGIRLYVEYAPKNSLGLSSLLLNKNCNSILCNPALNDKVSKVHQETVTNTTNADEQKRNDSSDNIPSINETLNRLNATAGNLNFNQPPPPYLYYKYPLINRDIIDSISIALECSTKFYIQVLHLMNRMNLEPPFVPDDKNLKYETIDQSELIVSKHRTCSTQTDEIIWHNLIRNKRKCVASDESELESSSTDDENVKKPIKRKRIMDEFSVDKIKEKQRKLLKMQRLQQNAQVSGIKSSATPMQSVNDVFELSSANKLSNIKIIAPNQLQTMAESSASNGNAKKEEVISMISDSNTIRILTDAELSENRIPSNQLKNHPLFQNYDTGLVSNRLYIKNLAKDVTENDLRAIYHRYLEENCGGTGNVRSIDIRLMTTGRMKGQAFITFSGPYLDCDDSDDSLTAAAKKYHIIEKALHETNGFILKNKVLVVAFGKKK